MYATWLWACMFAFTRACGCDNDDNNSGALETDRFRDENR